MPGGYGGTDIYRTDYKNGAWQEPVNAGPSVNTAGNELFPSLDELGMLFLGLVQFPEGFRSAVII